MTKKIKIVAIIERKEEGEIDEITLKHAINELGVLQSFDIEYDTQETKAEAVVEEQKISKTESTSEISTLITDSNKIYYGTLSIDERKSIVATIINVSNIERMEGEFRKKVVSMLTNKFEIDEPYLEGLLNETKDNSLLETLKSKFLEGDLIQMFIYIWEKTLSKGDEDDSEVELIETTAEKFSLEKENISETKKLGVERSKISKAIDSINTGKVAFNKLKAFEKTVLIALMLTECSTIDGKIAPEELKQLKNVLSEQFGVSANALTVILEKDIGYSLTKKVEQVEVYREKYELVEFIWEKILSTEAEIKDGEMELIRKWIRRIDISDIESEGARKDAEANINPEGSSEE